MHGKNNIALKKSRTNHTTLITEIEHEQVSVILSITHNYDSPEMLLACYSPIRQEMGANARRKTGICRIVRRFQLGRFRGLGNYTARKDSRCHRYRGHLSIS